MDTEYFKSLGLDDDAAEKAVNDLSAHTAKEREGVDAKNRELLGKLHKFSGVDVEKYNSALSELDEFKNQKLMSEGEYTKVLDGVNQKHSSEISSMSEEISSLKSSLNDVVMKSGIRDAIAAVGGNSALLEDKITNASEMVLEDGKYSVVAIGENGAKISLSDYIQELQKDERYAPAFPGSGLSGAGIGKPRSAPGLDTSNLTPAQKMAAGRS